MRSQLSIRTILLLTISGLTLLIILMSVRESYVEWKKLAQIENLKNATLVGDQLFDAAAKLSIERDIAFSLLHSTNVASRDNLRSRLENSRTDVDLILQAMLAKLKTYEFPEIVTQSQETEKQYLELKKLRQQIDSAIAARDIERDPALSQLWFTNATDLIQQMQDLWMKFSKHFSDVDPYVTLHMRFKYFLGVIMEYSGRQRSLIGRLIATNADPTPQEQAQLLQWQGVVGIAWNTIDTLADQAGLFPSIAPSFKDAKSHYYTVNDMVKDIFYLPGVHHGDSYPIDVELWLDLATQTTDSLYTLKDDALKQTQDYVATLESQARQSIIYHSLLLALALSLCFYSLWVIAYRVIRPINTIIEALLAATEGQEIAIAPLTYSRRDEIGKLAHVLHVFQQNIDEIRRANEALGESEKKLHQAQKMEAIGNLTGGMAHDFNNLLGVIIGNLDLLLDRQSKDEDKAFTQAAMDASLRGADLTRRLLAFARKQPLQPQHIEINKLVEGITKLLSRTLGENIEISLDLAGNIWPIVADPAQLEAALTNLATNARDAMPHGGKLLISTSNASLDADYATQFSEVVPGDYALITVSDTGSGMTPDVVNRIFEPFFTTKERGKGTGLGLSMVFGFIKQSGGHINVYSEPGNGTVFRLYLPRALDAAAQGRTQIPAAPLIHVGHETILVVEDNEPMRHLVSRQLRDMGYNVIEAENAAVALERLTSGDSIDLLFTDIVMPGKLNGLDLARLVQEKWPSLKIVLTSGFPENKLNDDTDLAIDGLRLLSKPYRKEELARILRESFEKNAKK